MPASSPSPSFAVAVLAIAALFAACAGAPETKPSADALAGCALNPGPAALCDGGKVVLDVATATGQPLERINAVQRASSGDDSFFVDPGAPTTSGDGAVTRIDTLRPTEVATATAGSVMFYAPNDGTRVVSCANFGVGDGACEARALALLALTVPEGATWQHKPALTLPDVDGCETADVDFAVQRNCRGGEKLSVVGIRGRFGPASAWWVFQRVVNSQATEVRSLTTCPVQGQMGPCGVVMIKDRPAVFGLTVERDELRITGCFFAEAAQGIPAACAPGFAPLPTPDVKRLLTRYDVRFDGCQLAGPDGDSFNRSVVCDGGDTIAQVDSAAAADALVARLISERGPATTTEAVACVVRGQPATCQRTQTPGRTLWRADVDDPRVGAFVCGSTEPTPAAVCQGFIDSAAP